MPTTADLDGSNWKATFMIEIPDEEERKIQLQKLIGIERHVGRKSPTLRARDRR